MKKIFISLIVLSFIFTLGCAGNTQPKSVTEPNETEPNETSQTDIFEIGQTVQLGDYYLTITKFDSEPKYDDPLDRLEKGYQVISVEVLIENKGQESKHYNGLDFIIQDQDGYTYEPSWSFIIEPDLGYGDLQPGRKVRGWNTFEVPENSSGLELIYQPSWWDSGQIIVKLTD